MDTHTENNQAGIDDARLKDRMNFGKMLDRQEKQIQDSPVFDLLQATNHDERTNKPEEVNQRQEFSEFSTRLDHIENLLESLVLNTSHQNHIVEKIKEETVTNTPNQKFSLREFLPEKFEFRIHNSKPLYILAAAIILSVFIGKMSFAPEVETIIQEKIVYKEKASADMYIAMKFVNLRETASTKAKKIMIVAPNSNIQLIERKGDWRKISFRDNVQDKEFIGWVYGENLKKIN